MVMPAQRAQPGRGSSFTCLVVGASSDVQPVLNGRLLDAGKSDAIDEEVSFFWVEQLSSRLLVW